jgi:ATP-dependent exoDNAse (exonuclease V) alpha subunit
VAICFVRAKVIGRSGGRSATAAAAYRSGEKIVDRATNKTHDYTKKQGIDYSEILTPIAATAQNEWLTDRSELWNRVEATEKRYDAQLAREMIIAIPRELERSDQINLVREHVQTSYVDRGMIADINLHHLDGDNPHAHVMLTMRKLQISTSAKIFIQPDI